MGFISSWVVELEETTQSLVGDFIESVHAKNSGRTIILGLLGPHLVGPIENDGWFEVDFVMAHHIYSDIGGK